MGGQPSLLQERGGGGGECQRHDGSVEAALAARGGAWGIEYQRHGGSGISCKGGGGGRYERGCPPLI